MAPKLHKVMEGVLGSEAVGRSRIQKIDLEIKDIDEVTMKEEGLEAIQQELGADGSVTLSSVRSLRFAYNRTQVAVVRLTMQTARKLLELKNIQIQWSYCRIRELMRLLKCFKCWNVRHLSRNCRSQTDRSKCCIKCGKEGHKVVDCKAEATVSYVKQKLTKSL